MAMRRRLFAHTLHACSTTNHVGICEQSLNSGLLRTFFPDGIVQTVYLQDGLHYKDFTFMQQARHDSLYLDDGVGLIKIGSYG